MYYSGRLLTALTHTESNTRTAFSLFVSTRLGMCDRWNSLVCNPHFAPYEKRTARIF